MKDSSDYERMLIETVIQLETSNLTELLPVDVFVWWNDRKVSEERELEKNRSEALRFCEQRIKDWRQQQAAASFVKAGE